MSNVHPLLVHLPIALLTFSVFIDVVGVIAERDEFQRLGWWTLLAGILGLVATIVSGLLAANQVTITPDAAETFDVHRQMAFVVAALFAVLLLWRIASRSMLPGSRKWLYLILSVAGTILLWIAAWYGGTLVYTYAIGVRLGL